MELVLTALLYLCIGDGYCEEDVKSCMRAIDPTMQKEISRELQSEVFQYCFETSIMSHEN